MCREMATSSPALPSRWICARPGVDATQQGLRRVQLRGLHRGAQILQAG
ncbi:Uncharacterised protein [Bordetella pertussis]|nr:Uncharacterised protein [Bordetella pertussis]